MSEVMGGHIFNIQRYSIHDGPGIRSTVFFKGCPLRCFWCQNPESQRVEPEIFLSKEFCTRCGKCVSICSTGASSLLVDSSTIDRSICIGCGKCAEVCPNEARRLVGSYISVDEIMKEVIKDKKFYDNSGGGVTLGGGEPSFQPKFALAILQSCKEAGLHTTIDTCGYAPWSSMEKLLEYTDLFYYDIKCIDTDKHQEKTGVPNHIILENAKRIANYKPMRIRVPLIPGFNDSIEDIKEIVHFVKEELGSVDIDLLPYNKMSESKYERLDMVCVPLETQNEEYIQTLEAIVSQEFPMVEQTS